MVTARARSVDSPDRIYAAYAPGGALSLERLPGDRHGQAVDVLTPATARRPPNVPPALWDRLPWPARVRVARAAR